MDIDDDDEFGDLYTDVLLPISSAPPPPAPPPPSSSSSAAAANPPLLTTVDADSDEILFDAPPSRAPPAEDDGGGDDVIGGGGNDWILVGDGDGGGDRMGILKDEEARVSVAAAAAASDSPPLGGGGEIKVLEDVEEAEEEPVIPGLSRSPLEADAKVAADVLDKEEDLGGAGGDDWESDSEDDLRIVLNETRGPIGGGLQRNGQIGGSDEEDDDDDDEDGEDLVIVADDGDQPRPPMMEEQEWGEEVAQQPGMDGERKDGAEAPKMNGPVGVGARSGYSGHGYHSVHMQYKYVRPAPAATPGGAAIGAGDAPGQDLELLPGEIILQGALLVVEWTLLFPLTRLCLTLISTALRTSLGDILELIYLIFSTLVWMKTIGKIIASDWHEQLRLEATMQSRIRVYESGRSEQDYDPDLPPELAAAAGLQDMSAETTHIVKEDGAQIVLQGSVDDSITSNGALEQPENGSQKEDFDGGGDEFEEDDAKPDPKYPDRYVQAHDGEPFPHHSNPRPRTSADSGGKFSSPHRGRGDREDDLPKDKSGDSIEEIRTSEVSSPMADDTMVDLSLDQVDDLHEDDDSIEVGGEEIGSDAGLPSETNFVKKPKLGSQVEPAVQDTANSDDLRTTQSDTSKGKSGSSRDYQKRHEGGQDEVMQDSRSRKIGDLKRHRDEDEHGDRRKDDFDQDSKQELIRSRAPLKGRDDISHSYPHKDLDSRDKERDIGSWNRREEDARGRRPRDDDTRRERFEEPGLRNMDNVRLYNRNDKDEDIQLRKRVDDVDWRGRYDKDVGRHENFSDLRVKRKEEESQRRERADKDDGLHGYRGREDVSQRRRGRDDTIDPRRRDDIARPRGKSDDHHSVRHRDDSWRQREREDRPRLKPTHDDMLINSKREEGRGAVRNGRVLEEKPLAGSARIKESRDSESDKDYQHREKRRQNEQLKRRDRVEEDHLSQYKGREDMHTRDSQSSQQERNSRHEKSTAHNGRLSAGSDDQQTNRGRHRGNARKAKETEDGSHSALVSSRRKQEDQLEKTRSSSTTKKTSHHRHHNRHDKEQHERPQQQHSPMEEDGEVALDDDSANRGRSKLERWTSQKERDYIANVESSPSSTRAKEACIDESTDNAVGVFDSEIRDADTGPVTDKIPGDRHLDTFEKLKKRSERFKLPMPIEKDNTSNKKLETEVSLPIQTDAGGTDFEIKQERPARKRRWVSG
ncbi:hypothetical protein QJS04_geneDACA003736 [Acorus gramineus]|uniref:Uncharacterized protein n=1 Tax=Acorus gramineus TaxID=55184 RepID=A0AAV9BHC6_ACOGR|nr:hypothetical protein QJS04_geneDACA003736 [Acorus gramineus]